MKRLDCISCPSSGEGLCGFGSIRFGFPRRAPTIQHEYCPMAQSSLHCPLDFKDIPADLAKSQSDVICHGSHRRRGPAHHVDYEGGGCEGDGDVGVAAESGHAGHGADGGRGIVPGLQVGPPLTRLLAALHPHRQPPPMRLGA